MSAPDRIKQLVETFEQNIAEYRSSKNETELRRQFLDPFFEALGWDVGNKKGYDERSKEVAHEHSVEIDGVQKKADYAFRTGRDNFDFLVEAKKPSVRIESSLDAAYQIRRYGWSAGLPINILTDFEHFAVYDCRTRPNYSKDKAATGRLKLIHYSEYAARWDEIAELFSPAAIRKGALDKFREDIRGRKGTQEVDDAFLEEIEAWRESVAKNIALRNKHLNLNEDQLNFAVQMTIDRIVFLRIAEERGMEKDGRLMEIADPLPSSPKSDNQNHDKKGKVPMSDLPLRDASRGEVSEGRRGSIYQSLLTLFQGADARYNSGLFHFKKEKGRENPDTLTQQLEIDDKVLKDIIKDLYYPSPYAFNYIPADILGSVYERFLGKVIRLTAGGNAKVDEKPEVRKAGGVYYTPTYIVDYIVKNTVGQIVNLSNPDAVSKIKIVDPACGSGSFLLGAYQYLLDWHLDWYASHQPEKWIRNRTLITADNKTYRLSLEEKKRILLNNIHGVDLDPQAVEVTKLSLLLKVVEDPGQLKMFEEGRILPDLSKNIKNGNALIGADYFSAQMFADMDEMKRVKPFDWQSEFPEVFKRGGFDAVIGNPPYIRIQAMQEWASEQVEFYKQKYTAASKGNYDIYVVFIEKGLSLLNPNGRLGFILPHKFFNAKYGEPVRGLVAKGKHLSKIVHFGDQQVFDGATTYTCLMFLDKRGADEFEFTKISDLENWRGYQTSEVLETSEVSGVISASRATTAEWNFTVGKGAALFEKLSKMPVKLGDVAELFVGLQTDADDVYILEEVRQEKNKVLCYSKYTEKEHWLEDEHLKPFLKGSLNIRRYYFSDVNKRLIFPYVTIENKSVLIDPKTYQQNYPLTWSYLEECKPRLSARNKGRMGKDWYGYVYKKNHTRFKNPKLLVPSLATGSCFSADLDGKFYFVGSGGGGGGGYGIILLPDIEIHYLYLLGILNSNLISQYLKTISTTFQHGYIALNRQYIEQLPIRAINFADPAEKDRHDRMVSLVEQMLALHKTLAAAKSPQEGELIQRQIASTDRQIDELVYRLYGLTEEEIRIVEG
jgi:type I restriction-modification system DNA methylase subunit